MNDLVKMFEEVSHKIDLVFQQEESSGWKTLEMEKGSAKTKILASLAGRCTIAYTVAEPGSIFPAHAHDDIAECIMVLSNSVMTVCIGERHMKVIKCQPCCIAKDTIHRAQCDDTRIEFLAITMPDNPEWLKHEPEQDDD